MKGGVHISCADDSAGWEIPCCGGFLGGSYGYARCGTVWIVEDFV